LAEDTALESLVRRWECHVPFTEADRQAIRALPFVRRSVERDTYLVREGDDAQHCTLLLSGFAHRHKLIRNGARQIISIHIRGEFIDLQNSMLGVADHNVQTLCRSEIAQVPRAALRDLSTRHPEIGRAMWIDTLIDASIFREWVVNVGRRNSQSRIAHLLCELTLRMELAGLADAEGYDLPVTQEQLADATGLTSVHVNRVLRSLREEGLISLTTRSLRILNAQRLREVGDFNERYLHLAPPPVQLETGPTIRA
jgi:CRP-like cAMP-binding protein